jgi:molecular chaperone GrpE
MSEESSLHSTAPDDEPQSAESGDSPELASARAEAAENWNKYLLAAADLDNVRRRTAREIENARKYGVERLAQELLPVRDSLEAGIVAAETDQGVLLEGMHATLRLLDQALESVGIREIDPLNEPFDPTKHEAIGMRSCDAEPNSVVDVVQKGYEIHERLLRPARVIVSQ